MWLVTCDGAPFEQGIGLASLKSISLYQRAKGLLHEGVLLKQPRNSYVSALGGSQPTLLAVRTHLSRHDSTIRNVQFLCKGKIDQPTACVCSNAQIKCPIFEPHTCLHSQPASRGASFVLPCGLASAEVEKNFFVQYYWWCHGRHEDIHAATVTTLT